MPCNFDLNPIRSSNIFTKLRICAKLNIEISMLLIYIWNENPLTLESIYCNLLLYSITIIHHYSLEELGGMGEGVGGKKPSQKPGPKPNAARLPAP